MSLELQLVKKEIQKKTNRLNYIKNKEKILAKQKEYQKTYQRKPWSERSDNPNKNLKIKCPICSNVSKYVGGNQNQKNYHCEKCSNIFSIKPVKHV